VISAGGGSLVNGAQCSYPLYVHEPMQNNESAGVM